MITREKEEETQITLLSILCLLMACLCIRLALEDFRMHHNDGLVQDCSNSSAFAMGLLQSCAKLSILNTV